MHFFKKYRLFKIGTDGLLFKENKRKKGIFSPLSRRWGERKKLVSNLQFIREV